MKPTIGVCGFGRCGTSMTMAMLAAGGVPIAGQDSPPYELPDLRDAWSMDLTGKAVKLLDVVLRAEAVPYAPEWRFVWLDRDHVEQARSAVRFLSAAGYPVPPDAAARFRDSYRRDRPDALRLLRGAGPVLVLRYERVLEDPRRAARRLKTLWPELDVKAAAGAVERRDGRSRRHLAAEVLK